MGVDGGNVWNSMYVFVVKVIKLFIKCIDIFFDRFFLLRWEREVL